MKLNYDRRLRTLSLSMIASTTLATAVFAQQDQTEQPPAPQPEQQAPGVQVLESYEAIVVQEPAGAEQDTDQSKHFIKQAGAENKLELVLSHLAQEKAENQQVKKLAQRLDESHSLAGQRLQQIAQEKGIPLDFRQFQHMVRATGRQFDQQYLSYITQEGRDGMQMMEQIANNHPDPAIQRFARQQLPDMRQYLQQAERAQTQIRASGAIQEPAGAESRSPQGTEIQEQAGAPGGQQGVEWQVQRLQQQVQQLQQQVQQLEAAQKLGKQAGMGSMPDAQEFVKMAAAYCKMGAALNQLASERAQSQQVRQLVEQQQQSMQQTRQQLQQLAQQHGIQMDTQTIQNLRDGEGRQFDQAYLRLITDQHGQSIQQFERAANEASDQQIKQYAQQRLPQLRQHLEQAQKLQSQLQASGGSIQEPAGAESSQDQEYKD